MHRRPHGPLDRGPHDDTGADVPLLRHGARDDGRDDARHDALAAALLLDEGVARLHKSGAHHMLPRRSDDVHRDDGARRFRQNRLLVHAHGNHGGKPLPDSEDARRRQQDEHEGNRHSLRTDGGFARLHDERHGRLARGARRDGRPRAAGNRVPHRRP